MALQKKQSNSNKVIAWAIGVLILAGLGYFAYTRLLGGKIGGSGGTTGHVGHQVITNFGEGILKDKRFTELHDYTTSLDTNEQNVNDAGQPEPFQ